MNITCTLSDAEFDLLRVALLGTERAAEMPVMPTPADHCADLIQSLRQAADWSDQAAEAIEQAAATIPLGTRAKPTARPLGVIHDQTVQLRKRAVLLRAEADRADARVKGGGS